MIRVGNIFTVWVWLAVIPTWSQHPNVFISQAREPNEPTVAVDPRHPLRMVAGSNQDNVYTSEDGGRTWKENYLTSPFNVRGDPSVVVDTTGAYCFFHLSDSMNGQGYYLDRLVMQRLDSGASTWTSGVGIGYNPPRAQQDKEWAAVDPRTNALYVTWTQDDRIGSTDPGDHSNILFSKSLDGGQAWSTPIRINEVSGDAQDQGFTVEGAVPAVGPNGEIYVSWMGPAGLVFNRSVDGGTTWMAHDVRIDSMPTGWNFHIPGLIRANGFPVTACDNSAGLFRGTVYVSWSDQSNGPFDTDVWLSKSTDGGLTWSARKRVNDDPPGKQQFFPWMSVDPSTGFIWIVFYDRREHNDSLTDVYLACSRDGGTTFVNFRISQASFMTQPDWFGFLGDYLNISAVNGIIRPIWIRADSTLGGIQRSVWTALIDTSRIGQNQTAIRFIADRKKSTWGPRLIAPPNMVFSSQFFDLLGRRHQPLPLGDPDMSPSSRPSGHASPELREDENDADRERDKTGFAGFEIGNWIILVVAAGEIAYRIFSKQPGSG